MRKLLLLLLLLLFCQHIFAQRGAFIGILGGYNTTWVLNQNTMDEPKSMDYTPKFGPNFGAAIGWNFVDKFGIHIEGFYSFMGQKYEGLYKKSDGLYSEHPFDFYNTEQSIHYLQFPVLLKFRGGDTDGPGVGIMLGPTFSLLQSAHIRRVNSDPAKANDTPFTAEFDRDNTKDFAELDYAITLALGSFNQINKNLWLLINMRFNYGLSDIIAKSAQKTYTPSGDYDLSDPNDPASERIPYGKPYLPSNHAWAGLEVHFYFLQPY